MTTQELHIGLDLELQQLNSFKNKNFLSQEKDWFLNKEVLKFIESRLSPESNMKGTGFQDTTERIKEFDSLVKTSPVLYLEENDEGNGLVSLPSDYFHYISADIYLAKDCNSNIKNSKTNKYKVSFNISIDTDLLETLLIQITTSEGLITLFDFTKDLPEGYLESLDFKKQIFMLVKALKIILPRKLKTALNNTPFDLYWEYDKDGNYYSNTFFLYSDVLIYNALTIVNNSTLNVASTIKTETKYDLSKYPFKHNIRLVDNEYYTDAINSHLAQSSIKSPLCRLLKNQMEIAKPKNAVMGGVRLTYICKPTLADLLLNSNINMNRVTLDKVLVNTVSYIKSIISSPNYNVYKQENILIE